MRLFKLHPWSPRDCRPFDLLRRTWNYYQPQVRRKVEMQFRNIHIPSEQKSVWIQLARVVSVGQHPLANGPRTDHNFILKKSR